MFKLFNVKENDFRRHADGTCQTFVTLAQAATTADLLNGGGAKIFIVRPDTPATDSVPFFGALAAAETARAANRRFAIGMARR